MTARSIVSALALVCLCACSSKKLDPMPASVDVAKTPQQKIEMKAKKYDFEPERVVVKQGTLLTLEVTSVDVVHGIAIPDYGIDERLDPNVPRTIRLYLADKGTYKFHCSHFCGVGHLGMSGEIVVE